MRPGIPPAGCKPGVTTMKQGTLFSDDRDTKQDAPLFIPQTAPALSVAQDNEGGCKCPACKGTKLEVVCERTGAHSDCPFQDMRGGFNHCTLEGKPARIIGRSFHYATIEPVDVDEEPIRCCWNVVADILENCDGAFVRDDDNTDE
jgi:hypothetical protein